MTLTSVPILAVMLLVAAAAYTDLRRGKIYNAMTLPAIILGIVLNSVTRGTDGLLSALGGIGLALVVWVFSGSCGACMGGGDIKLLGAVGALCGAHFLLMSLAATVFAGGVMAVAVALRHRQLRASVSRLAPWLISRAGLLPHTDLSARDPRLTLPYALPIAIGVLTCLLCSAGGGVLP